MEISPMMVSMMVFTELGKQFVHYAMTELTARIEYHYQPSQNESVNDLI